nr:pentapeptide repeat-containing protein [Nostoc sp. CHAB 5715]
MLSINLSKVRIKHIIDGSYKSKPSTTNHHRKELMNKPNPKKLTQWIVTAVFLVLVAAFSLLDQPSVKAQTLTPSIPTASEPAPVISPVTSPIVSVAANVRRLLQTNECAGCNLTGAMLKDANLQAANLEGANLQDADLERANLQQTNLQGANFQGADLGKVTFREQTLWEPTYLMQT